MVLSFSSRKNRGALKWAMYAVLNMQTKISELADMAPDAPTVPKLGCNDVAMSGRKRPPAAYAPPKYRIPIAKEVYAIPIIPKREKGANVARFFTKHSGRSMSVVTPISDLVLVVAIENVDSKSRMESARIIEYDKFPMKQSNADERAITHDVFVPRVLSQASAYDVAPVILHTLAINMKV